MKAHRAGRISKFAALTLLMLAVTFSLAMGRRPALAEAHFDASKPFLTTTYIGCVTGVPTGLVRYDFCDGRVEWVEGGRFSPCFTQDIAGDCL